MTGTELQALLRGIAPVVREYVTSTIGTLTERLTAVETRAQLPGPPGERGPAGEQGLEGPAGANGQDGAPGIDGVAGQDGVPGPEGASGPPGAPGPTGEPGPRGERGEKGIDGLVGDRGPEGLPGPPGRDGRDGLPGVQGEKGLDGKPGRDGIDGIDGRHGADGLGFEDLTVLHDGERGFTFRFQRGDQVKAFPFTLPVLIYRGVWTEGQAYVRGDVTTFAGHLWHAEESTAAKPDEFAATKAWTLCVRRGKEGKAGKPGEKGLDGKDGRPGRDLTQTDGAGRKW